MGFAVLVVDMQNGFIHSDGSNASRGGELFELGSVIEQTGQLVAEARHGDIPIIYTQQVYRPDHRDAPPIMRALYDESYPEYLVRGSWDGAIHDALAPHKNDTVVQKNRFDAFLYTDLELVLRALRVDALLICGVTTATCVELAARSADQRDFVVMVATDCVSDEAAVHQPALDVIARHGMPTIPWREALTTMLSGEYDTGRSSGAAAVAAKGTRQDSPRRI